MRKNFSYLGDMRGYPSKTAKKKKIPEKLF